MARQQIRIVDLMVLVLARLPQWGPPIFCNPLCEIIRRDLKMILLVPILGGISGHVFSAYAYPKMAEGRVCTFFSALLTRAGQRAFMVNAFTKRVP
jgi:hypothetical protein